MVSNKPPHVLVPVLTFQVRTEFGDLDHVLDGGQEAYVQHPTTGTS
jgi:hypothetical protein